MIPEGTSPEAIVIVIVLTTLVGCVFLAALFWYRFPESHEKIVSLFRPMNESVNRSADSATVVMSRSEDDRSISAAPSLQTDARQTPDRPMIPKPTPEQWLTLYQLMRRHGIKREDAGVALRAAGLTLDNNTWSKAQPPEPAQVTPIAGRPTDADFPYEPIGQ